MFFFLLQPNIHSQKCTTEMWIVKIYNWERPLQREGFPWHIPALGKPRSDLGLQGPLTAPSLTTSENHHFRKWKWKIIYWERESYIFLPERGKVKIITRERESENYYLRKGKLKLSLEKGKVKVKLITTEEHQSIVTWESKNVIIIWERKSADQELRKWKSNFDFRKGKIWTKNW